MATNPTYGSSPFAPGSAGENAFRAAYNRLLEESKRAKEGIASDYASMYQNLRGQAYQAGLGQSAQKGLSGGQISGQAGRVGAQQIGAFGQFQQGQQKALSDQRAREASIYSNALIEGQQAQDYLTRNQQSELQRQVTTAQIIGKTGTFAGFTQSQQISALVALGYTVDQANNLLKGAQSSTGGIGNVPIVSDALRQPMTIGEKTTTVGNFLGTNWG